MIVYSYFLTLSVIRVVEVHSDCGTSLSLPALHSPPPPTTLVPPSLFASEEPRLFPVAVPTNHDSQTSSEPDTPDTPLPTPVLTPLIAGMGVSGEPQLLPATVMELNQSECRPLVAQRGMPLTLHLGPTNYIPRVRSPLTITFF